MSSVALQPLPRSRVDSRSRRTLSIVVGSAANTRRRSRWPWIAAAACFVLYLLVGIWLIESQGFTIHDADARTTSALIMSLGRDPHLGAMGFYWPPLPMLIRVPFVLMLEPFGKPVLAGPITTALCVAASVPVLARIGRELRLRESTTAIFVGMWALNPVTVYTASNAMSEAAFALVVAFLLLGVVRVANDQSAKNFAMVGLSLAVGIAVRAEFIPLTVAATVAVLLVVPRPMRRRAAGVILVPPIFVFALWSWASSLIAGDALFWYHTGKVNGGSVPYRPWLPSPLTPVSIVGYVAYMILVVSPALVLAIAVTIRRRSGMRVLIGLALISFTVPAFVALQLKLNVTTGEPRYFSLIPEFGCVLSMWAIKASNVRTPTLRRVLPSLLVCTTLLGAVVATYVHARPKMTQITSDGVFYAQLLGRPGPKHDDYAAQLKPLIDELDPELAEGKLVAMDSQAGYPILFSKHPRQFIVPEDRKWEQIMADPSGRFDYALVQSKFVSGPTNVLRAALQSVDGGSFVLVATAGSFELYRFQGTR